MKLLLNRNADVESRDKDGLTPLSWVSCMGPAVGRYRHHVAVMKLLLDRNADVESKDNHGMTPLSLAPRDTMRSL